MAVSMGHIPVRWQFGCKPLCFCATRGIQSLRIEAAQEEQRIRGNVFVKGMLDNDGICPDRAGTANTCTSRSGKACSYQ